MGLVTNEYFNPTPELAEMSKKFLGVAFGEDVVAVKHMQKVLEEDTTDYDEININGDKAAVLLRRKIVEWVQQKYPNYP